MQKWPQSPLLREHGKGALGQQSVQSLLLSDAPPCRGRVAHSAARLGSTGRCDQPAVAGVEGAGLGIVGFGVAVPGVVGLGLGVSEISGRGTRMIENVGVYSIPR